VIRYRALVKRSAVVAVLGVTLAWGEWENWRASRQLAGPARGGEHEAVVVLGFRNRGPTANALNRWRVRAGLRSLDSTAQTTRLVLSGGRTGDRGSEAALMADYARVVLGYRGALVLEENSTSTWENVTNVIPLIDGADQIKLVSDPLHALKARAYLLRQRPDLADRLARGGDYRVGEWLPLKPLLAVYGRWTLRRVTTAERTCRTSSRARRQIRMLPEARNLGRACRTEMQ
jgi:uncharacterized SAM-binding protein YcdF (DUF218 family)